MGHREQQQVVAVHLGALLQQRNRLLAVGRVVVHEGDLLALELVQATLLLADVLDQHVGCRPIAAAKREVPAEHGAVGRVRAAVTGGQDRDLVVEGLVGQRKRDSGRHRVERGRAGRSLPFQALVTFDATVGRVAGLALFPGDLDAVDAAVSGVDQFQIIHESIGERDAVRGIGARPVRQHREELLLGLRQRRAASQRRGHRGGNQRSGQ